MNGIKRTYAFFAGILMAAICAFEISEISRYISMISGGNSAYTGELVIKSIFVLSLIAAGILFILGKAGKGAATLLTVAGGVSLYKTFAYIIGILGNEMIFGIVYGNIIDMLEIVFFIAPAAVILLSKEKITKKNVLVSLIIELAAFAISLSGNIASFAGWGKTIADISLFFDVYGLDMLRALICLAAFSLSILSLAPDKRKKHR